MMNFILACIQLDPIAIVQAGGYLGIALLIFVESGLLIGLLLPGDSLLFAAGLFAAAGYLDFGPLVLIVIVAAILGDTVGYWFGRNVGDRLFARKNSKIFKQEYVERAEKFFRKYGGRAVALARFVPIVRTLVPMLAGIGSMKYSRFASYNALGAFAWGGGMTSLGFFLGSVIPDSERYILPITLFIIFLSFLPIIWNLMRGKAAL